MINQALEHSQNDGVAGVQAKVKAGSNSNDEQEAESKASNTRVQACLVYDAVILRANSLSSKCWKVFRRMRRRMALSSRIKCQGSVDRKFLPPDANKGKSMFSYTHLDLLGKNLVNRGSSHDDCRHKETESKLHCHSVCI
jgi:hypothetical protein